MNNHGKATIGIGIIVFLILAASPFLLNLGKTSKVPEPELTQRAKDAKECVESKEFMKTSHMQLLNDWRDAAVRDNLRVYINDKGNEHHISLQNTCLDCHSNKDKFCDRCHNYVGVGQLYCWDCHIESKEKQLWAAKEENF
jgi:hypothetical protein